MADLRNRGVPLPHIIRQLLDFVLLDGSAKGGSSLEMGMVGRLTEAVTLLDEMPTARGLRVLWVAFIQELRERCGALAAAAEPAEGSSPPSHERVGSDEESGGGDEPLEDDLAVEATLSRAIALASARRTGAERMRWEGELAELEAMGSGCPARLLAVLCRAQARHLTVVAQPHMQRAAAVRAAAAAVSHSELIAVHLANLLGVGAEPRSAAPEDLSVVRQAASDHVAAVARLEELCARAQSVSETFGVRPPAERAGPIAATTEGLGRCVSALLDSGDCAVEGSDERRAVLELFTSRRRQELRESEQGSVGVSAAVLAPAPDASEFILTQVLRKGDGEEEERARLYGAFSPADGLRLAFVSAEAT